MTNYDQLKNLNHKEKAILSKIYLNPKIKRAPLQKMTDLKTGNFYDVIDSLISKDLVQTSEVAPKKKIGRPTSYLNANNEFGYFYHIFLTKYDCRFELLNFNGDCMQSLWMEMSNAFTVLQFKQLTIEKYSELLQLANINDIDVLAVSVVSGIPINPKGHTISYFFKDTSWATFDIEDYFETELNKEVVFDTIANSAGYGSYLTTYRSKTTSMLYLLISDGIGLATVHKSKLVILKSYVPSSIEHWIMNPQGKMCTCGKRGCLLTSVGTNSVIKNAKDYIAMGMNTSLSTIDDIKLSDIDEACKKSDPVALSVVNEASSILSVALKNMLKIFETDHIVLSGRFINSCDKFFELTKQFIQEEYPDINVIKNINLVENTRTGIAAKSVLQILK